MSTHAEGTTVDADRASYLILTAASLWVLWEAGRQAHRRWTDMRDGSRLLWFAAAGLAVGVLVMYVGLVLGAAPWLWRPVLLTALVSLALGYRQNGKRADRRRAGSPR
jgi:small-conductance mechanosensitive channel